MKAYLHLVKYSLNKGLVISVFDGDFWEVQESSEESEIYECIESVKEASIRVFTPEGDSLGAASVAPYGLADDETVIDHSTSEFFDEWWNAYKEEHLL